MTEIAIPYGGYWSSPFAKWQGKLAHLHSLRFAAKVAKESLEARDISPEIFDFGVLGMTIPRKNSFYCVNRAPTGAFNEIQNSRFHYSQDSTS